MQPVKPEIGNQSFLYFITGIEIASKGLFSSCSVCMITGECAFRQHLELFSEISDRRAEQILLHIPIDQLAIMCLTSGSHLVIIPGKSYAESVCRFYVNSCGN